MGLLFQGREFPVGANFLPAGEDWKRIRLFLESGRCRALLGSREFLSAPVEGLPRREGGGVGLKAWGGRIEVRNTRWRPLP